MPYALYETNDDGLINPLYGPSATFTDHEITCIRITIGVVAEQSRKLWAHTNREDTYTNIWNKLAKAWKQIEENECHT